MKRCMCALLLLSFASLVFLYAEDPKPDTDKKDWRKYPPAVLHSITPQWNKGIDREGSLSVCLGGGDNKMVGKINFDTKITIDGKKVTGRQAFDAIGLENPGKYLCVYKSEWETNRSTYQSLPVVIEVEITSIKK